MQEVDQYVGGVGVGAGLPGRTLNEREGFEGEPTVRQPVKMEVRFDDLDDRMEQQLEEFMGNPVQQQNLHDGIHSNYPDIEAATNAIKQEILRPPSLYDDDFSAAEAQAGIMSHMLRPAASQSVSIYPQPVIAAKPTPPPV